MRKNYTVKNLPYWDEELTQYIIDAAASAPDVLMKQFTPFDKELLRRVAAATLEQKLYLLGKLGKRFAIVVADRGKVSTSPETFRAFTEWCKKRLITLAGHTLKHWGLFIRGDKELIQNLSRLSIDITPKTMYLLRNYEEIAAGIDQVSRIRLRTAVEEQSSEIFDKWMLKALTYYSQLPYFNKDLEKVTQQTLCVLFYLMANKERLITSIEVSLHFGWDKRSAAKYCSQLELMGVLQQDLIANDLDENSLATIRAYQLTGYGLTIIKKIRDEIASQ